MLKKKTFTTLVLFFVLVSGTAFSQHFLGALSAGMNLSQVDGDEKYGYNKVGINVGPSVIIPFGKNKNWSITMELLYSQLGSRARSEYTATDSIRDTAKLGYYDGYRLNLDYVQIPIIIHYIDKNIIAGGLGVLYGQLINVKEYEDFNDSRGFLRTDANLRGPYTMTDWQVLADVKLRIWEKLWLNVRYSYSLAQIRNRTFINPFTLETWTRKQYNNVVTLRLTYIFNEPLPLKNKKKTK